MNDHDPAESDLPRRVSGELPLLLLGLVLPSAITYLFFVVAADYSSQVQQLAAVGGKSLQFVLPLIWWCLLHRRRIRCGSPQRDGVAAGVLFGLAVAAAMMVSYFFWLQPAGLVAELPQAASAKVSELGCDTPARYIMLGCFYTFAHSFLEEYYWRWFIFGGFRSRTTVSAAVLISSIGFMAHHVIVLARFLGWLSPATWLFSLAVGIGGAFWAWLYHRSEQLYAPWISHLIIDAAIFTLGYTMVF